MKTIKSALLLAMFLSMGACGSALAAPGGHGSGWQGGGHAVRGGGWHGGGNHWRHSGWRGGVGITFGAPLFWPPYGGFGPFGPYDYYPPAVIAVPVEPPTYIEQNPQGTGAAAQLWYFCPNPKGYYPYVQDCPVGWVPVAPQPPANN